MSLDLMKEETLKKILDSVGETNVYLKSIARKEKFDPTSLRTISELVQNGVVKKYININDQIIFKYTYNDKVYDLPFDVVHFGNIVDPEGNTKPGMFLRMHPVTLESVQFDAPEKEVATETAFQEGLTYYKLNSENKIELVDAVVGEVIPEGETYYHNEIRDPSLNMYNYGYNRYSQSALIQWLNSAAGKGEWWKATHIGDCPPSQLNSIKGFLAGFEQEVLDYIKPFRVVTACNNYNNGSDFDITYDRFTVESLEEMYIEPQVSGEGETFDYYKEAFPNNTTFNKRYTDYPEYIRYAAENNTSAQVYRLRSAGRGNSGHAWYVGSSGSAYSYGSANYSYRCAPVCVIY